MSKNASYLGHSDLIVFFKIFHLFIKKNIAQNDLQRANHNPRPTKLNLLCGNFNKTPAFVVSSRQKKVKVGSLRPWCAAIHWWGEL